MGNKTLIYKQKLEHTLNENYTHLRRVEEAFDALEKQYTLPFTQDEYKNILNSSQDLAFSDQIIYSFSKLQDSMGAKLFKSILLYQGENVDKPFLDILNQLEKMGVLNVDEWFEIRDLRNEISHEYDNSEQTARNILNMIYELKEDLKKILEAITKLI